MTAEPAAEPRTIDLRPLFAPRSVAVVGASPRSWIAGTVRDNLRVLESATTCHFVNPRYDELLGQPCYPDLASLPERPDVVLVALNPLRAAAITADAARAGVPAVIIPGGGVVEGGAAAAAMQADVGDLARRHGLALLGPNCMGVWDLTTNSAAYIGDVSPALPRGGIAGIAQSGSVSDAFIHSGSRIGFSRIVSCGSEVAVDLCDHLAYCLDDPETEAVILFVEGFKRPERFLALADRALQLGKPIVAVKVGRSDQAQAAAVAHTGSLAGETRVTDAALDAVGVIRCGDLDELFEAAALLEGCRRTGRRVGRGRTGVVTVSTGEGSLIADMAPRTGIDLPSIPDEARAEIVAALPTMGYVGNPLDPWGAADAATAYRVCFDALAGSGAYDVLAIVHDFPYRSLTSEVATANEVAAQLLAVTADRPDLLPVYVSLTSGEPPPETTRLLDEVGGGAPVLRGALESFSAIARLGAWEVRRERRQGEGPRRRGWPALAADRTTWAYDQGTQPGTSRHAILPERESLEQLERHGLPVVPFAAVSDAAGAVAAANEIGYPIVLKVDAVGLAHKADVGAVRLDLATERDVHDAAHALLALDLPGGVRRRGLLVQRQAPAGLELILGVRRDPQFGPVVLVGIGGIFAEAIDDVAVGLAPIDAREAERLVRSLRGATSLRGARGRAGVDLEPVIALLVRLGAIAMDRPEIEELDLNPVIASAARTVVVDALMVVSEAPRA